MTRLARKEQRENVALLLAAGLTVRPTRRGHLRVLAPDGTQIGSMSGTPKRPTRERERVRALIRNYQRSTTTTRRTA